MCLTADPGVVNAILTRSHTSVEIDHEIGLNINIDTRRLLKYYEIFSTKNVSSFRIFRNHFNFLLIYIFLQVPFFYIA